jgi:hypothetical protein
LAERFANSPHGFWPKASIQAAAAVGPSPKLQVPEIADSVVIMKRVIVVVVSVVVVSLQNNYTTFLRTCKGKNEEFSVFFLPLKINELHKLGNNLCKLVEKHP